MNSKHDTEIDSDYNRFNKFKILAHAKNIECLLNGGPSRPIVVDLELSNLCQQDCVWCEPISYRMQNHVLLKPETITQVIEDAAELGTKLIRFCGGGEPMTNPFYGQALRLAKQKGLGVICNSNGSLLHKYLDTIVEYCDYFRISLDAATNGTYCRLHQPKNKKDFENIVNGLTILAKLRVEKFSHTEIGAAFLIHHENYEEISLFTRVMREIGIDFVHFRPVYLPSKTENQKLLAIIDYALAKVAESKQKFESEKFKIFGITRKMNGVWFEREWSNCYSPFFLPVLGANGNIYACCDRRDICLGSFAKEGFAKIYRSKKYKEKVKAIDVGTCVRCTNSDLNEIIYNCFEHDFLKKDLL